MSARWDELVGPLAALPLTAEPRWSSGISDDSSPFEFSLVLDERAPEVRLLWESQGENGELVTKMDAALRTHRRLCTTHNASSRRFDAISELFLPSDPRGTFAMWHAARLWPAIDPELKLYLNPQIRGSQQAGSLVREALSRLGLDSAWEFVERAMARGPASDEIRYFALDLREEPASRVKVYVYHHDATPDLLEGVAMLSPFAEPSRVRSFFERLTRGGTPASGFAPATCLSFVGQQPAPVATTLHVPIRAYVRDDREAADRVASLAHAHPGDDAVFAPGAIAQHERALDALRRRPLEAGVGLSSYVSLRSQRGAERVTCYLSTEMFGAQPPRTGHSTQEFDEL